MGRRPKTLIRSQRRIRYLPMEPRVPIKRINFEKSKCPYCMRGFHPESECMNNTMDQLSTLLEQNNISLAQGAKNYSVGEPIEDHERCHAFKEGLTQSKDYLIYFRESNHMVSTRESFTTLNISRGPSIHMGDNSEIPTVGKGSIKIMYSMFPILQQICYLLII